MLNASIKKLDIDWRGFFMSIVVIARLILL